MAKQATPKFRDPKTMTEAELTDPDYRLKQIAELMVDEITKRVKRKLTEEEKQAIRRKGVQCTKCHHCR